MQLFINETNNAIKNRADLSRHSSKEDRWPKTHEKMLSVTYYQINASQNYNEVSPHTSWNDHLQEVYKY